MKMRLLQQKSRFRVFVRKMFYLITVSTIIVCITDIFLPWTQFVLHDPGMMWKKLASQPEVKKTYHLQWDSNDKNEVYDLKTQPIEDETDSWSTHPPSSAENPPNILIWQTANYLMAEKKRKLEFKVPDECGGCTVTTNRSTLRESIAVVLFNHNDLEREMDIPDPKTRKPWQHYVFWSKETPAKLFHFKETIADPRFDSIFNLTWTFFRKADIRSYFGTARRAVEESMRNNLSGDLNQLVKSKKKVAVWVVSNCYKLYGTIWRLQYARKLQEAGLKLDKFGKCFDKRNDSKLTAMVKDYKFYLSFENSLHCPDYITEKFWRNGLAAGLVPIVWGPTKADVEAVAPKNSFIHADDFETPRDLVKYIKFLDKHDDKYLEYHKWRNTPLDSFPPDDYTRSYRDEACRLCRRIVVEKHPPKTVPSISKWFYDGYPDDKCLLPFANLSEAERNELVNF